MEQIFISDYQRRILLPVARHFLEKLIKYESVLLAIYTCISIKSNVKVLFLHDLSLFRFIRFIGLFVLP